MRAPDWARTLVPGDWHGISGDEPALGLSATAPGTRCLEDGDPAADPELNPNQKGIGRVRRLLGRYVNAPWSGRCGFSSITEAWNGAVYACNFGDAGSMVIFGGGHNDYFGSDVHAFDLATREWQRISDGYVTGSPEDYGAGAVYACGEYPDGSPLPPHTYGYVQYDEAGNDFLIFKSQKELGQKVEPLSTPHLFNLTRKAWRRGPEHLTAYLGAGGWTAWDDKRRLLWGNSGDGSDCFLGYSPDGENPDGSYGCWGPCFPGKLPGAADHCVMAYDPRLDYLIVVDCKNDRLCGFSPETPNQPLMPVLACTKPPLHAYAALEYSPGLESLVYYSATQGPNLWRVRSTSMEWAECTWENLTGSGNRLDPIGDAAQRTRHAIHRSHTFGRFRVASFDDMDLGVLVRHVDTPVYVIRLA